MSRLKNNKMKFSNILITVLILLISTLSVAEKNIKQKSDEAIHSLIIGSWVVDKKYSSYNMKGGAISTYQADGVIYYKEYSDKDCKNLILTAQGKWKIYNGMLFITVTSSSRPDLVPIGYKTVDIVIAINKTASILVTYDAIRQYRYRSDQCIIENEI